MRAGRWVGGAVLAAVLVACAEPVLPDGGGPEGAPAPIETEVVDPGRDALLAELAALTATLEAAHDRLVAATAADSLPAAQSAGAAAVGLLLDDPQRSSVPAGGPDPLFPAETAERGDDDGSRSQLVATLTVAREAGELGRRAADVLGEPIAGDLGAWQGDAAGMVTQVGEVVAGAGSDLAALEAAVLELPGDGTRALAWALLVADAPTRADAAAYAERGLAHLDLVLAALATLDDAGAGGDGDEGGA